MKMDCWFKDREVAVDVLAALFGVASWVAINGLWVELPLLVQALPEGWSLPSYLSVIIQIANIGPLAYGVLSRTVPRLVTPSRAVWATLCVGVAASVLMPIFWDETAFLFGAERSVALLALTLALSLVDCTSSVLFLPYIGLFKSIYLPSYLLGEGLSALLPSLVATIQGVGKSTCVNSTDPNYPGLVEQLDPPLFSTEAFFGTLAAMMIMSTIAFSGLEFLPICKHERLKERETEQQVQTYAALEGAKYNKKSLWSLLAIQFWLCLWSNGFMVGLQSYSCMPYGSEAYHWAAILFNVANPLACVLALVRACVSIRGIFVLLCGSSLTCAYLLWTAATSPSPPLVDDLAGAILVVLGWFVYAAVTTYAKVSTACVLRQNNWERDNDKLETDSVREGSLEGSHVNKARSPAEDRLFYYGVATQVGSLVGSIIAFVLVNVLVLFQAKYPCQ
ncbi:solute carrier family 52, riboflavin transporter, member 3-A [Neocloeon triangulifer]|uniref:solute carrier family 52, riboflavin transporter, member 3-A n=1 Tax=Neocloeon triangulifer TaxID=2078957 RepID=UPI00286F3494|nr:solute carrier family 52, riboflavin transporter, member 3-A [Neocloeon triangulifer]XP_059473253.1 solute carrier family 52, riboflavin transporter, member 3-A [Neocloeon triangulifer]XP_059473254.1 solute carrier family 52, riboflavin transporter, member 3-A [Neocloeon triangulifer]